MAGLIGMENKPFKNLWDVATALTKMVISAWKDNVAPPVSGSHVAGGWHS